MPKKPTPAYFNVVVIGYDVNKKYEVCYGERFGVATVCKEIEGKDFPNEKIQLQTDPKSEQRKFACVRDLTTNALKCEETRNTPENPQIINIDITGLKIEKAPQTQAQTQTFDEETDVIEEAVGETGDEDSDDGGDGKDSDNGANPYCDLVSDDYKGSCHDRYDYDELKEERGEKDIYLCNDGEWEDDPKDCKDASGYDYNDNGEDNEDTGGSNPDGEESDQNCGGESCTDDEKEDSWTDEDEDGGELFGN